MHNLALVGTARNSRPTAFRSRHLITTIGVNIEV